MRTHRGAWLLFGLLGLGLTACSEPTDPAAPGSSGGSATADVVPESPGAVGAAEAPAAPDGDAARDGTSTSEQTPDLAIESFTAEIWTWDQTSDTCSHSNNGNPFWDWMVVGREPAQAGKYPLFLYVHGTGDVAENPVAVHAVARMAARGFVAASIPYDSLGGIGAVLADPASACPIGAKKAACLFGSGEGSPITKLCAREKAACDRGIVLAGHSQGAWLATLAKNHDSRVRAVYGLGHGIHEHVAVGALDIDSDLSACLPPSSRALPADRLRVVDGQSEYVYGTSLQADVRELTGLSCPAGAMECMRPDGSGWAFFPDAANQDGRGLSQHCYMANMPGGDCTASTGLNTNWSTGTQSYGLEPSLAWLRKFVD